MGDRHGAGCPGHLRVPTTPPPTMILHDPQEEALQRLRDQIPASCDSACEIVIAAGNPVALIVHMARARTVDLIVMARTVLYGCDGGDDDDSGLPDIRGLIQGTSTQTVSGCSDPANNGTSTSNTTLNILSQNGADFSGSAQEADGNTTSCIG